MYKKYLNKSFWHIKLSKEAVNRLTGGLCEMRMSRDVTPGEHLGFSRSYSNCFVLEESFNIQISLALPFVLD